MAKEKSTKNTQAAETKQRGLQASMTPVNAEGPANKKERMDIWWLVAWMAWKEQAHKASSDQQAAEVLSECMEYILALNEKKSKREDALKGLYERYAQEAGKQLTEYRSGLAEFEWQSWVKKEEKDGSYRSASLTKEGGQALVRAYALEYGRLGAKIRIESAEVDKSVRAFIESAVDEANVCGLRGCEFVWVRNGKESAFTEEQLTAPLAHKVYLINEFGHMKDAELIGLKQVMDAEPEEDVRALSEAIKERWAQDYVKRMGGTISEELGDILWKKAGVMLAARPGLIKAEDLAATIVPEPLSSSSASSRFEPIVDDSETASPVSSSELRNAESSAHGREKGLSELPVDESSDNPSQDDEASVIRRNSSPSPGTLGSN